MAIIDPDWQIWRSAQQGSEEAYAHLREAHRCLIHSQLQVHCHCLNFADLEEVEQDVWVAVWRSLPRFGGRAMFKTWLVGLARNVLFRWLRRKRSREETLTTFRAWSAADNDDTPHDTDLLERLSLSDALDRLPSREHQVIALRYFEEAGDREISQRLKLPLGTVKSRIRSALGHLRQHLDISAPTLAARPRLRPAQPPEVVVSAIPSRLES